MFTKFHHHLQVLSPIDAKEDMSTLLSDMASIQSSSGMTTTRPVQLLDLPFEVLITVINHINWPSLIALRRTNTFFAYSLIPESSLSIHHITRQQQTWDAERRYLQLTLGYGNPNWTGFTQGWGLSTTFSLSEKLPCYHCLRWLQSPNATLSNSAFSRGMATKQRDLGMGWAASRVCVDCGVRSGKYPKGSQVRNQVVCYECGKLGEQVRSKDGTSSREQLSGGLWKGKPHRWRYFCGMCVEDGKTPETRLEFEHERRWGKYEKGMAEGKEYRLEKGRRLRAERGLIDPADGHDGETVNNAFKSKHTCPTLNKNCMCQCWRYDELRRYKAMKLPHYIW